MIKIPLTQNQVAVIDNGDWEIIAPYKWFSQKARKVFYAKTWIYSKEEYRKCVEMSKLIMGFPDTIVDHIDRNPLNNQRSNLRLCTTSQSAVNRFKFPNTISSFRGVTLTKYGKWQSCIGGAKTRIYLGIFNTETLAAEAYNRKAKELYGEFAVLNIIETEDTDCETI